MSSVLKSAGRAVAATSTRAATVEGKRRASRIKPEPAPFGELAAVAVLRSMRGADRYAGRMMMRNAIVDACKKGRSVDYGFLNVMVHLLDSFAHCEDIEEFLSKTLARSEADLACAQAFVRKHGGEVMQ
jgi:hypothetical protein